MTEKMMALFQAHLKAQHNLEFYDYQLDVVRKIFNALIQNLRLTSSASEEAIKKLKLVEIPVEFSRQSGKTTTVVHAIEFLMTFFATAYERPISIGIFAPQREQAKTDFDRLKTALMRIDPDLRIYSAPADEVDLAREESNAKTIVLPSTGSSCYVFPVTATSKPESKSLDLMIFEESQDLDDLIVKEQIWPMGASTNAPRIYLGTAGTEICYYYRLGQGPTALKLYFDQITSQRRKKYEETANVLHLIYERTVQSEIDLAGLESDEIQRPYFGKWLIGTGQFVTQEDLEALQTERNFTQFEKSSDCYAGIDTAKIVDSTVVTIIRWNAKLGKKELLSWLELRGDNYQDQFEIIHAFLKNYKVIAVALDATGQGDFMPDLFENSTEWRDEHSGLYRVKFSALSKDILYKNLKVSIKELLTTLPNLDTKKAEKFKQQMLDLQQEYKGPLLSVHHPKGDFHDDYPDSWALAEHAFTCWNRDNNVDIHFVNTKEEPHVAIHKETDPTTGKERVLDYWPGLD